MACHAMSITITVVLPTPVASFRTRQENSGFTSLFFVPETLEKAIAFAVVGRDVGEPDCDFSCFYP
jgi:hypothetical protein